MQKIWWAVIIHYHVFQLVLDVKVDRTIRPTNSDRIDGVGAEAAQLVPSL